MSTSLQTLIAAALVLLASAYLLWSWFGRKKKTGCEGECSAVSSEVKKLRSRLK